MAANDIKAGGAWVEITAKDGKLRAELKNCEGRLAQFANKSKQFSLKTAAAIGAGFFAAKATLSGLMTAMVRYGDTFDKMAQWTGLGTKALSELKYTAEQSGTSIETVEASVRTLQKSLDDAANGSGDMVRSFQRIGVSIQDLQAMKPEDQFKTVARALGGIEDASMKAALAQRLLGDAGTQLLPMFNAGKDGMDALIESANELGLVISEEDADACAALGDSIHNLKQGFFGLARTILAQSVPALTDWAGKLGAGLKSIIGVVQAHPKLAAALTGMAGGFIGISGAVMGATQGIKLLVSALTLLKTHPAFWIAGAISGIAAATYAACRKAANGVAELSNKMSDLRQKNDEKARTDKTLLERLQELSVKQNHSNAEIQEAVYIAERLNNAYSGLGLTVDETTGKIIGLSKAFQKMTEIQNNNRKADVGAEIYEIESNIENLKQERRKILPSQLSYDNRLEKGKYTDKEIAEDTEFYDKELKYYVHINKRKKKRWNELTDKINIEDEKLSSRKELLSHLDQGIDTEEIEKNAVASGGTKNDKVETPEQLIERLSKDSENGTGKIETLNVEAQKVLDGLLERVKTAEGDDLTRTQEQIRSITVLLETRRNQILEGSEGKKAGDKAIKEAETAGMSDFAKAVAEANKEFDELKKSQETYRKELEAAGKSKEDIAAIIDPVLAAGEKIRDSKADAAEAEWNKKKNDESDKQKKEASEQAKKIKEETKKSDENAKDIKSSKVSLTQRLLAETQNDIFAEQRNFLAARDNGDLDELMESVQKLNQLEEVYKELQTQDMVGQLKGASMDLKTAAAELKAAEQSMDKDRILAAQKDYREKEGNFGNLQSSLQSVIEEQKAKIEESYTIADFDPETMIANLEAGIQESRELTSRGSFSAFDSSNVANSYERDIAESSKRQEKILEEMRSYTRKIFNNMGAAFT